MTRHPNFRESIDGIHSHGLLVCHSTVLEATSPLPKVANTKKVGSNPFRTAFQRLGSESHCFAPPGKATKTSIGMFSHRGLVRRVA